MNTITLQTERQVALFREVIQPQISDGLWENDNGKAAERLYTAEVIVRGHTHRKLGCNFYPGSFRYDLTELLEIIPDEMLAVGRRFDAPEENYGLESLELDLQEMGEAMRKYIKAAA